LNRKVVTRITDIVLHEDLQKYRSLAISQGASDCKIIPTSSIILDERVLAKCFAPTCSSYGTCANCPPHTISIDDVRKLIGKYNYGLLMILKVPSAEVAGTGNKELKNQIASGAKLFDIVSQVESQAFHNAYYLAMGFGSGSCRTALCSNNYCSVLSNRSCRYPQKARPSMEAMGIDAPGMAVNFGWDVYPTGSIIDETEIPFVNYIGLVLIC
jgi:predicted metal-binding protein